MCVVCRWVGGWVCEFDSQKCQKLVTDVLILIMMGFLFKGSLGSFLETEISNSIWIFFSSKLNQVDNMTDGLL